MEAQVVQRFRECQNLLDSVVANLSALHSFITQRTAVEEAARRLGSSTCLPYAAVPRCCTDPLGMLAAFPESALELIIAQHDDDMAALLHSLNSSQQAWGRKLQQAKNALQTGDGGKEKGMNALDTSSCAPRALCAHSLIAVLARMHGWLRDLILALRTDLARSPPRAVKLSAFLAGYDSQLESGGIPAISLSVESALGQLADRVTREWEASKLEHIVEEAWLMLVN